jgi:hypothetical protein
MRRVSRRVSTAPSRVALGALLLAAACGSRVTTGGRAPAELGALLLAAACGSRATTGGRAPAEPTAPTAGSSAGTAAPAAAEAGTEQQVGNYYRGKTIRIVVGFAPGGGFDTYARLIAKYVPGRPTRTPEHPWLQGVPAAENLATSAESRQLLATVNGPSRMSKPYAVAPEVPRERVEALRQALAAVAADAEFLAEAEKAKLDVVPLTGAEVDAQVRTILDASPAVVAKLKDVLK